MNAENVKIENLRRISVIGTSCSGKTTFAEKLAQTLNIEHVELDAIYWLPDWAERPRDEFADLVKDAADRDSWVFDGNYTQTREIVWGRATAIVWLDYSFPRIFYRALNRTTRRVLSGEAICSGNRETFRQAFLSRDSILLWVLTSHRRNKRQYLKLLREEKINGRDIIIFRHPGEAENFLRLVGQTGF